MRNENCDMWHRSLMRNYPGVNIERVIASKNTKGFIVYVDGEGIPLNQFLRRFSKFRISRICSAHYKIR